MRFLYLLICLMPSLTYATQVKGILSKNELGMFISTLHLNQQLQINVKTYRVEQILGKLNNGDMITSTGDIEKNIFNIKSIDYVGLRKLLGTWVDKIDEVESSNKSQTFNKSSRLNKHADDLKSITFLSFNEAYLHNLNGDNSKHVTYSLTPAIGPDSWYIFISSDKITTLARILFSNDSNAIILTLYDQSTGEDFFSINLYRKGN